MVGVVHSSSAIDAIQRFIGRIELGMLPSIIDTIIFIEGGDISTVFILKMTVKVPHGFRDKDLARPVVEVRDFKNDRLEFEIYNFGNDVVVNPISSRYPSRAKGFLPSRKYRDERISLDIEVKKQKLIIKADPEFASQNIVIFADNQQIFTGSLSRNSDISLSISNKEARKILKELNDNKDLFGKIK